MSADQKKKLLWGNKKNTTAEEVAWEVFFFFFFSFMFSLPANFIILLPFVQDCEGQGTSTNEGL